MLSLFIVLLVLGASWLIQTTFTMIVFNMIMLPIFHLVPLTPAQAAFFSGTEILLTIFVSHIGRIIKESTK